MGVKTVTIKLTESVYERLCRLATESEEFLSETVRRVLRKALSEPSGDSEDVLHYHIPPSRASHC
jgi:predicted CopG family antitoxin